MSRASNLIARVRALGTSTLRLGAALAFAFAVTGLLGFAGHWFWTYPDRVQAKESEAVRRWASDLASVLSMKASAKTKLVDGTMFVAFDFHGHPDYLTQPSNRQRGFYIRWDDADGFARVKKYLQVSEFTTRLNEQGEKTGLYAEFTEFASLSDYAGLAAMSVEWTVHTETPKPPSPIASQSSADEVASSDHCAPGLGRQERMRRLARHGQVRETGLGEFTAGHRSMTFISTGEVLSCR